MKVHYFEKRLTLYLSKSDKNYRNYYLKTLTVELYFSYKSFYQMNFQVKHFQKIV